MEIDTELVRKFQTLDNLNALEDKMVYTFSHARLGNMDYRWGIYEDVLANRYRFSQAAGFSLLDLVVMDPTEHGINWERVTSEHKGDGVYNPPVALKATDCLMTTEKNLVLGMITADCAPIIVTNKSADFISLHHGSRKCIEQEINYEWLNKVAEVMGIGFEEFVIGLGPSDLEYRLDYLRTRFVSKWIAHLTTANGEKPEVIEPTDDPAVRRISSPKGKMNVDLAGFIREQLIDLGVLPENISISEFSTSSSALKGELFSHQVSYNFREFPEARFMTAVWLKPQP